MQPSDTGTFLLLPPIVPRVALTPLPSISWGPLPWLYPPEVGQLLSLMVAYLTCQSDHAVNSTSERGVLVDCRKHPVLLLTCVALTGPLVSCRQIGRSTSW